ncbi:MAG: dockerin type I repeat-containing protein, partial [Clostridia bacterium]|nr:dockerin type I repeat-containing protein [Clostridia bacterium]
TLVLSANAAGSIIFSDDFNMGFKPVNWIQGSSCAFKWDKDSQCLIGYGDARVLQPNYSARDPKKWDKFYCKYDVQIRDFDDMEPTENVHTIGIWYRDLFENPEGSLGAVYNFYIEIDGKNEDGTPSATSRAYVVKDHTFKYKDENNILQDGRIDSVIAEAEIETKIEVGEEAPWYELGIRVTEGNIQCYFNQELIFDLKPNAEDEKIGDVAVNSIDATVGSHKSPVLLLASRERANLYCAVDNFEVWTPDYDFSATTYGDVNGDTKINLADASLLLKKIAKWDVTLDETAADVTGDGKINLADASLLLKKIAKWDVELGPQA